MECRHLDGVVPMIKDIFPPLGVWTDARLATGIATGKRLVIQNKGSAAILVWEGSAPPTDGDTLHGYQLMTGQPPYVTSSPSDGCWLMHYQDGFTALGRVCVQEYTA